MTDIAALENLISEYWCLAYAEGKDGRTHDTADGAAQRKWSEIQAAIRQLAPVPAQGQTKTHGEILQLLRDIEANVQRAWKDGSLSAKAWPADIGRRLSDVANAKCAEIAQGAEGVEALATRLEAHADAHANVSPHDDEQAEWERDLREAARRLRNSPQPDVAAEVLRIADEREAGYSRREHGDVVNGKAADAVVALAERLRGLR